MGAISQVMGSLPRWLVCVMLTAESSHGTHLIWKSIQNGSKVLMKLSDGWGETRYRHWQGTPIAQEAKLIIDRGDCVKLKRFCPAKAMINRAKRQSMKWEEIIACYTPDTGVISRIYKTRKKKKKMIQTLQSQIIWSINGQSSSSPAINKMQIKTTQRFCLSEWLWSGKSYQILTKT